MQNLNKKQVYNPFLPLWEYVPDGEPHVFGDRLYLFGSHDVEGGERYCASGQDWEKASRLIQAEGVQTLELQYAGEGSADLLELEFEKA